tara:strand:+ start:2430 stop:2870 length:441 start_codon:yes stop_codon:yes gene_type:complete
MKNLIISLTLLFVNISCAEKKIRMDVYMSPTCGCCKKWVSYLENNGFEINTFTDQNMRAVKTKYKISQENTSCHTGIVDGYYIEGHVPASDIKKLLKDRSDIAGLTVPGMPAGQNVPGMETVNTNANYDVFSVNKAGVSKVWNSYN